MGQKTKKLMNDYEMLVNEPSDSHSYLKDRCLLAAQYEQDFFNECLGFDFYQALLLDVIEFEWVYFKEGIVYQVNDYVNYNFIMYKVIQETDGTQNPKNTDYFEKAAKFTNQNYQTLWDDYLKLLIAFTIKGGSIEFRWVKDTAIGLVQNYEEGKTRAASMKQMDRVKQTTFEDVDMITRNMMNYMLRNKSSFGLAVFPNTQEEIKKVNRGSNYGFTGLEDE